MALVALFLWALVLASLNFFPVIFFFQLRIFGC